MDRYHAGTRCTAFNTAVSNSAYPSRTCARPLEMQVTLRELLPIPCHIVVSASPERASISTSRNLQATKRSSRNAPGTAIAEPPREVRCQRLDIAYLLAGGARPLAVALSHVEPAEGPPHCQHALAPAPLVFACRCYCLKPGPVFRDTLYGPQEFSTL